jgi:DNA-directed RNA polymerase subunit RPC12/RpoP
VPNTDALDHAEALGDGVEAITADGRLAPAARDGVDDDTPTLAADAWHAIGSIEPEWVRCPGCGARFVTDDEAAELPTCPRCGTRDTWEARQESGFRALLAAIDRCASRAALGQLGRRLYARRLPRAQAGVAWTHYRIRKATLEAGAGRGAVRPPLPTAA